MEYLGHELTTEGIQPTARLVKAVADFPRPTDAAGVRRFVTLTGYYRRFVPSFGARMSPLTKLLRKTSEWKLEAEQEAFEWTKAWLSRKPVLIYPDYRLPFKLTSDASKAGLGAVLSQDQGHGDQPVTYASKVNNPTVAKYSISKLKCLAVVWAVRLFRPHLYGRKFVILTDHVALKWLMTTKEPAGRLHRWALTLQKFDFEDKPTIGELRELTCNDENEPKSPRRLTMAMIATAVAQQTLEEKRSKTKVHNAANGATPKGPEKSYQSERAIAEAVQQRTPYAVEDEIDHAADDVMRAVIVQRVEAAELGIVQFTDDDVKKGTEEFSNGSNAETTGGIPKPGAAVEYTTMYAVAEAVPEHTAKTIARFLMNRVVLVYGPMMEIMMDGAREFGSKVITELLALMQVKQATPVPYRPNLLGLVERFHRTWKDILSLYVNEEQDDWDDFVPSALYAYNSSTHATHGFQPNELMMGKFLRTPAELLRRSRLTYPNSTLAEIHEVLMRDLETPRELVAVALQKEQARQAIYYNRRNACHREYFRMGQLVP
ncbi:unnamed protein product [Phytophthora fragariaefolia]|uniref:Unnamed protein product n=1 Tax=Phytophthora fragariaefolia TaxID=1490495 RepID=A0A9W7D0B0_9STRA|nr:unnamed protein product [Phytophthora fragariaefolia]